MDGLVNFLRAVGPGRLIVLLFGLAAVFSIMFLVVTQASKPPLTLLYGGLDAQEASEIAQMLDGMSVTYEVRNNSSVYVPQNMVGELRLKVAGEGHIGTNTTGYEIFDEGSGFGTTSFVQNINARRALEGELARTITTLPAVKSARVHLVLPKRQLFSRNDTPPTAAVALNVGTRILTPDQIASIGQLVASAVPNLKASDVTVVDQRGNLLGGGKGSEGGAGSLQERVRQQVEADYELSISRMLEKVVGPGKVSVKVNADMDFDRTEELSEIYHPDQQVVRSEQRSETVNESQEQSSNPAVGVTGNVPDQGTQGTSVGSTENQTNTQETVNYEIGKTVRRMMTEGGAITGLSVAVLVEGRYEGSGDDRVYTKYSDEEIQKFESLVRTAIGYDESRGDKVEVIDMPFRQVETPEPEAPPMFSKEDYFKVAEYVLLLLGILIVVFVVIKPSLKAIQAAAGTAASAPSGAGGSVSAGGGSAPGAAPPSSGGPAAAPRQGGGSAGAEAESDAMMDISQVEGRVRESTVKKVTEIIDAYPEESVTVVRGWMAED